MLRSLHISDYALIDDLKVGFGPGLNIITGETGAGKSILIGALQMILGERASKDVIRRGAEKSIIEGVFDQIESPAIREVLEQHEVEWKPLLVMRREISSSQSRAFINDTPATATAMRAVADLLLDLHGQHEHQSLLRTETHLDLLDHFGGHTDAVDEYRRAFRKVSNVTAELDRMRRRKTDLADKRELYEFQIQEIDELGPSVDEEAALADEMEKLENRERVSELAGSLYAMLYDNEDSVYDRLGRAMREFMELVRMNRGLEKTFAELESAKVVIDEVARSLAEHVEEVEFDPERLTEVRSRIADYHRLAKKYGGTTAALVEHRTHIGKEYETTTNFDAAITRLERAQEEGFEHLSQVAFRLSELRKTAATEVEIAIVEELKKLGIKNAEFEVRIDSIEDDEGWVSSQWESTDPTRYEATESGIDSAEFYISANVGEEPKPLAKVASGGEVSRIMLAMKTILAKNEAFPVLVFDEIDSGISGAVSQKVGESLRNLGEHHQILCITHLPQIAAMADFHYVVEKTVAGHRTRTSIRRLGDKERAEEVATLMSGAEITEASIRSARELMAISSRNSWRESAAQASNS
ncbi:MAG: DNA repair protein RecN [Rhodothermia bacterium]|nr:DNA repair protein RecN [Rhodothermia bacterium]